MDGFFCFLRLLFFFEDRTDIQAIGPNPEYSKRNVKCQLQRFSLYVFIGIRFSKKSILARLKKNRYLNS